VLESRGNDGSLEVYHEEPIPMPSNRPQTTNGDGPDVAYITPAVLSWAVKRSRLTRSVIERRLGIDTGLLETWERPGGLHPPFAKAQELAKILHVPFGFFFLKRPPSTDLPLPDFRGFDRKYEPSADLLELLNDILMKRDWFSEHEREIGAGPLKFVGSYTIRDSIEAVADAIRARIGIGKPLRDSASSWSDYLTLLTRRTEQTGILVMRSGVVGNFTNRKLQTKELLGFAIADQIAPVVFVNSSDFRASQIFTLAHELVHIWIGQSAIANPDELEVGHDKVEAFCNHVAAEVLVPQKDFLRAWRAADAAPDIRVNRMARRFWVSSFVTLRRAHELGEMSDAQYEVIKRQERDRRKQDKSSGGDYYRNVTTRMSPKLTDAVLSDVNSGKLEIRDAAALLNMKVPTLVRFAEKAK
jgi:Zn-dependent peptidase ImmA (M78 family)